MTNPVLGFNELASPPGATPHADVIAADRALAHAFGGEIAIALPDSDYALDTDEWQYRTLRFSGSLTAARTVTYPDVDAQVTGPSRLAHIVVNETGEQLTVKRSGQTGVAIAAGDAALVWHSGADIVTLSNPLGSLDFGPTLQLSGQLTAPAATIVAEAEAEALSSWSPTSLANLAVWFDPTDDATVTLTDSDTRIGALDDKSGNGVHLAAGASGGPDVDAINGLRAIKFEHDFSGVRFLYKGDTLASAITVMTGEEHTVFVVVDDAFTTEPSTSARYILIRRERNLAAIGIRAITTALTPTGYRGRSMLASITIAPDATYTGPHIFCYTYTNTDPGNSIDRGFGYIDGALTETLTDTGVAARAFSGDSTFTLGGQASSTGTITSQTMYDGKLGSVIVYDRVLSEGERQQVEGFLAHSWLLAGNLDSGHPYKDTPPSAQLVLPRERRLILPPGRRERRPIIVPPRRRAA